MTHRKIIHIDMDQFYAAVEQRDNPDLRGKPVAVGYDAPRGVVATASYEARPFGVHSALSVQVAKKRCPNLIIVPPNFQKYKAVSLQIHEIFRDYTDQIEPISLDEAFLDVTENKCGMQLAVDIAKEIKQRIVETTGLTASAGVSYCKFLAKIASDYRKPNGLFVIHPLKAQEFIDQLSVDRFWGVGKKTAERLYGLGIFIGADLKKLPLDVLTRHFGKIGSVFYDFARGIDRRPVVSEWERRSVSCERTFETDINDPNEIDSVLQLLVEELLRRINKTEFEGRTLTLKVKFHDFKQITRSHTAPAPFLTAAEILSAAREQLKKLNLYQHPIRLMGLGLRNQHETCGLDESARGWIQLKLPFKEDS